MPPPRPADPDAVPAAADGRDVPFLDRPGDPPDDKSAAWRWFFYALIGFLVGQIVGGVFGVVAGDVAGKNAAQMAAITSASVPPEWYVVSTLVGLWVGFFGAPWLASRTRAPGICGPTWACASAGSTCGGIAIGVGGQIVIALLYAPFQHDIHDFNGPSQKLTGGAHGGGFLVVALATVILAPFMEELFFRGLLFKSLARLFTPTGAGPTRARGVGVVLAVVVDGLLFGLAHGEWVQLAGLALFGVVLAAISYRTGRLGMNMVAHASFNLVAVLAILEPTGRCDPLTSTVGTSGARQRSPPPANRPARHRRLAVAPRRRGGCRRRPPPVRRLGDRRRALAAPPEPAAVHLDAHRWRQRRPLRHAGLLEVGSPVPRAAHRLGPGLVRRLPSLHLLLRPAGSLGALASYVVPYALAFKWVTVLGSVLLPVAAWAMGRLFGMRRAFPGALAALTLCYLFDYTYTIYGGNLFSTLAGEYAYSLSIALALLFLGLMARGLRTGRHRGWTAVVLAACILAHIVPALFALVGAVSSSLMEMLPAADAAAGHLACPSVRRGRPAGPDPAAGAVVGRLDHGHRCAAGRLLVGALRHRAGLRHLHGLRQRPHLRRHPVAPGGLVGPDPRRALGHGRLRAAQPLRHPDGPARRGVRAGRDLRPAGQPLQRPVPPAVVPPRLPPGRLGRRDGGDRRGRPVAVVGGAHRPAREPPLHGRQPVLRRRRRRRSGAIAEPASTAGEQIALYSEPSGVAVVAGGRRGRLPWWRSSWRSGWWSTPFVLPASAMKSIGITPGPNQVTNWSSFNYSGYQAQAAYPEYRALVQTMEHVGATDGCGQAMWQYDPSLNRFGTTQALMLLPYWSSGCIGSMEGLLFESSATTPYHFLNQAELSVTAVRGDGRVSTTRR